MIRITKKVKLTVLVLIVVGIIASLFIYQSNDNKQLNNSSTLKESQFDENNLPKFIQADFIELDKIETISKFRSGSGHDFSIQSGESCRSMKHYFSPPEIQTERRKLFKSGKPAPDPDPKTAISIFSPVDGKIESIEPAGILGYGIHIRPKDQPHYHIRISHAYPLQDIKTDSEISAGQKIAMIGNDQNVDMEVGYGDEKDPIKSFKYISYFSVMPDDVFAKYQSRGLTNRSDVVITKEYRDKYPFECNGDQFITRDNDGLFILK